MECKFSIAWVGHCHKETEGDNEFCSKHVDRKCVSCGEQATQECSETMGLVCGEYLCDTCEHTICDNGCNSGGKRPEGVGGHCKPEQQVYLPWYMKKDS